MTPHQDPDMLNWFSRSSRYQNKKKKLAKNGAQKFINLVFFLFCVYIVIANTIAGRCTYRAVVGVICKYATHTSPKLAKTFMTSTERKTRRDQPSLEVLRCV